MKHKKSIRIISVLLCMILVLSCYPTESTLVFAKQKKTSNQMEYIVLSDSNEELLKIVYSVTDCRSSQKTVNIAITNISGEQLQNWSILYDDPCKILQIWNAQNVSSSYNYLNIKGADWNRNIAAGASITFGYTALCSDILFPTKISYTTFDIELSEGITVSIVEDGKNGKKGYLEIQNETSHEITDWSLSFSSKADINKISDTSLTKEPNSESLKYTIYSEPWTDPIPANGFIRYEIKGSSLKRNTIADVHFVEKYSLNLAKFVYEDSDSDGIPDGFETLLGTSPDQIDSDGDMLPDGYELFTNYSYPNCNDYDENGISDGDEDYDSDGLTNYEEFLLGINPNDSDTDGDGMNDYTEISYGLNPNKQISFDDGILDGERIFSFSKDCDCSDNGMLQASVDITLSGSQLNTFDVEKVAENDALLNSEIPGFLGNAYDLKADNSFERSTLSFEVDSALLNNDEISPAIFYFNEDTQLLEEVENQTIQGNIVSANLNHFSKYILLNKNVYYDELAKNEIKKPVDGDFQNNSFDVVFALDESGSVSSYDFSRMKNECINFTGYLGDNDSVSLTSFDDVVRTLFVHEAPENAKIYINNLSQHNGLTAIYDSIQNSISIFSQSIGVEKKASRILILLTDGYDNCSRISRQTAVELANEYNVVIYTIGVGSVDSSSLKYISESTGGSYYYINDFSQLGLIFEQISDDADLYKDTDGDGVSDYHEKKIASGELKLGTGGEFANFQNMNYLSADTDGDGLIDSEEIIIHEFADGSCFCYMISNPCLIDSDYDNLDDFAESYIGTPKLSAVNTFKVNTADIYNESGIMPNTWSDWYELLQDHAWNFIHLAVQTNIVKKYTGMVAELYLPSHRRIDLYYPPFFEAWEVKPASYIFPEKMEHAIIQLRSYIEELKNAGVPQASFGGAMITNSSFNVADYHVEYKNLLNGIVIYAFSKLKKAPDPQTIPVEEKEKSFNYAYEPVTKPDTSIWLSIVAGSIIAGTLIEDFFTAGFGAADDLACFALAFAIMSGDYPMSGGDQDDSNGL